jgi:hypothetical protein
MCLLAQDQYDVLDFTDNELKKLDNFPRFTRLSCLLASNNHVSRISPLLGEQLASLHTLVLTNNRVEALAEIDHLMGCAKLTSLSLVGNPVARRPHYRLYAIHKLPTLKVARQHATPAHLAPRPRPPPPAAPPCCTCREPLGHFAVGGRCWTLPK